MVMEKQIVGPSDRTEVDIQDRLANLSMNDPNYTNHLPSNTSNGCNECSNSAWTSHPTSPTFSDPPSPQLCQPSPSPRPCRSPVFFHPTPASSGCTATQHYPVMSTRSSVPNGVIINYVQSTPHHGHLTQASSYHSHTTQGGPPYVRSSQPGVCHMHPSPQAGPLHGYSSQQSVPGTHQHPPVAQQNSWYTGTPIYINPAGTAPGGRWVTSVGCGTPGRMTPGRVTPGRVTPDRNTPGRCTPVYSLTMKKKYVDIMLASTASTVAIDNKIEQAMDLVKSHLMFAVREEVDVLKERIGELMEKINHLEYENTVLRKYAPQEALQQIQKPHGGAPNP